MTEMHRVLDALIDELELETDPDPEVEREVAAHVRDPWLDIGTTDETGVAYVTIDNPDSRDLDQAVHVARDGDGWLVRYAIADASFYAPVGSALWRRSLARGSSFYLPHRAVPMLPEPMSEGIISLNPAVVRRAVRFAMRVAGNGTCTNVDVERVRIRSRAKLSYEGVQDHLDGRPSVERTRVEDAIVADAGVGVSLRAMVDVGEALLQAARERDTTPIERTESTISIDPDDPARLRVVSRERLDVERYNEQISLLFNLEGARVLQGLSRSTDDVQAVYRVHLPPMSERLDGLAEILAAVARRRALDGRWTWRPGAGDLGDFVRGLPDDPRWDRMRSAVHRQVRYTFRSSSYRARSGPHHALGVDGYARLSAPMREVVGVFSHKELAEGLGWAEPRSAAADAITRDAVIAAAQRSRQTQRAIDKRVELMALDQIFAADVRRPVDDRAWLLGTVIGVRATRLYVALDGFALDVKVYVRDLEARLGGRLTEVDDVALVGDDGVARFVLGDGVALRVEAWDAGRRRYVLAARRLDDASPSP